MAVPDRPTLIVERIIRGGASRVLHHFKTPISGIGYLAGESPSGLVTVDASPASCEVRILYRPKSGGGADGRIVAKTMSGADGTWRVDGLDASLRYDIVARQPGYADVIVSDVAPYVEAGDINAYPNSVSDHFNQYPTGQNKFGHVAVG